MRPPVNAADSAVAALPVERTALAAAVTAAQAGTETRVASAGLLPSPACASPKDRSSPRRLVLTRPRGGQHRRTRTAHRFSAAHTARGGGASRLSLGAVHHRAAQDGLARSYSIASLLTDDSLELHVRVLPEGRMSQWLASTARVGHADGDPGPSGDCFYTAGREDQPLLLAGTGTGLAPLFGIARDALRQGIAPRAPVPRRHRRRPYLQ